MKLQNIHNLWSGQVDSFDGALQILLIVDYILDWARDLYRPGIYRLLESISSSNFDDTMSMVSDSDIHSLNHRVTTWQNKLPQNVSQATRPYMTMNRIMITSKTTSSFPTCGSGNDVTQDKGFSVL